jgi:hypothetical protein
MSEPARIGESSRLVDLEGVIERGLSTFVEVGEALLEIRDARLYRLTHGTFEDYCRERWGLGVSRTHQLMDAAKVVRLTSTMVEVPSERVARELVPVMREDPEAVALVMSEAQDRAGDEPVTAAAVRAVVKEYLQPEEQPIEEERDESMWAALTGLMESLALLTAHDAARVAATVPPRRRAATARRLRDLGRYLGRIAWTLEGNGGQSE